MRFWNKLKGLLFSRPKFLNWNTYSERVEFLDQLGFQQRTRRQNISGKDRDWPF